MKGLAAAVARDLIGGALSVSGYTSARRFGRERLNVATFHRVLPEAQRRSYPYPMLAVTPEELGWFLDFFQRRFLCTSLAGAFRLFELGVAPERPLLAITFDDAQLDNFVHAKPALESRGLTASFFVPVEAVDRHAPLWHDEIGFAVLGALRAGRAEALGALFETDVSGAPLEVVNRIVEEAKRWTPDERAARVEGAEVLSGDPSIPEWAEMMSWDQLRRLAADGHDVGSHSVTHALLPQLNADAISAEVLASKARIEAQLDQAVRTFCYPNGDCDDRSARAVEQAGYACAVTTEWGSNPRGADRYRLRRCDMNAFYSTSASGKMSAARVAWRMSGLHPGLGLRRTTGREI